ncbi:MAG TPA: hypothetical protein PKA05_16615, partial [Roseiflexaceae bacterium]|nr:hypothetical protein [Roseiflexaceae bacterium]
MHEHPLWQTSGPVRAAPIIQVLDMRLILILLLALVAGVLAYQAPPAVTLPIGWIGDRLFIDAGEGQAAAEARRFYGDELTAAAPSGRSRWTRSGALFSLPGIGSGDLLLTIRAQGWPVDVRERAGEQPLVTLLVDHQVVGSFTPTPLWQTYTFTIPAAARQHTDLQLELQIADTFTATERYPDPRPKGIRVDQIDVRAAGAWQPGLPPAGALALLILNAMLWLLALAGLSRRPNMAFAVAVLVIAATAIALTLVRVWV